MHRLSPRRLSLTWRFAIVSALAVCALGVVLAYTLSTQIERRSRQDAVTSASVAAQVATGSRLDEVALRDGLSALQIRQLDALFQTDSPTSVRRIKIFNRQSVLVYSDEHHLIGGRYESSVHVNTALKGEATSMLAGLAGAEHATERGLGRLLEAYVPLRLDGTGTPDGVVEVYLPYGPVEEAIRADQMRMAWALVLGLLALYVVQFRFVRKASARLRREALRNEHLASHDVLTGLPNRTLLFDRIRQQTVSTQRHPHPFAVVLLDLDRFKEVNDTLGHHNGDLLLQEVAVRIRGCLRAEDTVARLGGDEFGLLLPDVTGVEAAVAVAGKVREVIREPITIGSLTLSVGASAGVAVYPDHGEDAESLLQRADVAMYLAKEHRTGVDVYSSDRDQYSPDRLELLGEMAPAIANDEFFLYFQPKADLLSGRICGVEALVRWRHPRHGVLVPDQFIPLAEYTGVIGQLTDFVLQAAAAQCAAWAGAGIDLTCAVNVSALDIQDPRFPERVRSILAGTRLAGHQIVLEITETAIMSDPERATVVLNELSVQGITISIDDFGTGYSSLAHLQQLTVHELKIDRSFVQRMRVSDGDATIVRSTVDLGRNLGLRVVAEGVEDEQAWNALADLSCDFAQGYFLCPPMDPADLPGWIKEYEGRLPVRAAVTEAEAAVPAGLR